jgi:hypothetical protein
MTTTKYNRRKKQTNNKRLQKAQEEHEAWLESMGVGKKQLQEKLYDKYGKRISVNERPNLDTGPRVTSDRIVGTATAKERHQYTGNYIIGIATTHKSNLVPITNKKQAIEASQMRRN